MTLQHLLETFGLAKYPQQHSNHIAAFVPKTINFVIPVRTAFIFSTIDDRRIRIMCTLIACIIILALKPDFASIHYRFYLTPTKYRGPKIRHVKWIIYGYYPVNRVTRSTIRNPNVSSIIIFLCKSYETGSYETGSYQQHPMYGGTANHVFGRWYSFG